MINRYTYKETAWVDLINPTSEEIQTVMEEFSIKPIVANELTSPSIRSRAELHEEYIYIILNFPALRHSHSTESPQEIDFIIGETFLITARYDTIDAIDKFAKIIEVNTILNKDLGGNHASTLFFGIIEELYKSVFNELESIENWIDETEDRIFKGKEKEMVGTLSEISRALLRFNKSLAPHKEVWDSVQAYGEKIVLKQFSYHIQSAISEYKKIRYMMSNAKDSLVELRETNNSLVSTKQNEVMKVLTILAFVTFPLSLIASIFGMNTSHIPFVGPEYDFWIVVSIMLGATLCMVIFFKYKKWL